ncbi:MAG: UDP-N-acetylmuramate--L-alanine ligase [Provencibacterium sp.]|nr:UDP-N-acetylmuramate--L-alanine ligase [Provencibacterium sp.]
MKVSPDILAGRRHIHFIGIGGSGMFPLAQILQGRGYEISGSDNNPGDTIELERSMGMQVVIGQRAENIAGADAIIYSAAIMEENPELIAARASGLPVIERSELLGLITSQFEECAAVCGTHGKTTTTALLTHILLGCGKDPSAVIGGKLGEIGGSGRVGKSPVLAVEACEFCEHFLNLYPDMAVILNVDEDHLDYYKNLENIIKAFHTFAGMASRCVIYNGDDPNTLRAVEGIKKEKITFGLSPENDYWAADAERFGTGYRYRLMHGEKEICEVKTAVPGAHNILNSLAALAAAIRLGCDARHAAELVESFGGAGRRFEILGRVNGVTVADDYAHHPKEIAVTLRAAKEMGFHRVFAVHQPFTYSRTALLLEDFAAALSVADQVVLSEIMGGREHNTYGIDARDLQKRIEGCCFFPKFPEIARYVAGAAEEGDLVITLGCGDVYKCAKLILEELSCIAGREAVDTSPVKGDGR